MKPKKVQSLHNESTEALLNTLDDRQSSQLVGGTGVVSGFFSKPSYKNVDGGVVSG